MSMTQKVTSFVRHPISFFSKKAEDVKEAAEAKIGEKNMQEMKETAQNAVDSVKSKAEALKESAQAAVKDMDVEDLKQAAQSKMEDWKAKGEHLREAAKSKLESMDMQDVKNAAESAKETIKEKAETLKDNVKAKMQDMSDVNTKEEWDKIVKQAHKPIIVNFYKGGELENSRRLFPRLSMQNKEGYTLISADMEKLKDVAKFMKINVPSAALVYNGKLVESAKDEAGLDRIIKKANELSRE